jgi:hypothetical protein
LGFTIKPVLRVIKAKAMLLPGTFVSTRSKKAIRAKFRAMRFHKWRISLVEVAKALNPVIEGMIQYYHKFWGGGMWEVWNQLNHRLLKWVKWEKGLYKYEAIRWLRQQYRIHPGLFAHWKLVQP